MYVNGLVGRIRYYYFKLVILCTLESKILVDVESKGCKHTASDYLYMFLWLFYQTTVKSIH